MVWERQKSIRKIIDVGSMSAAEIPYSSGENKVLLHYRAATWHRRTPGLFRDCIGNFVDYWVLNH